VKRSILVGTLACLFCGAAWAAGQSGSKPDAITILKQNSDAMAALQSYRAECVTSIISDPPSNLKKYEFAILTAEKPLKMRYDMWRSKVPLDVKPDAVTSITFACDGAREFAQYGSTYKEVPKDQVNAEAMHTNSEPWLGFYSPNWSILSLLNDNKQDGETSHATLGEPATAEGVLCDVVTIHDIIHSDGVEQESNSTYYFGKEDHLVRRLIEHIVVDGKGRVLEYILRNIETSPKIDSEIFTFTPPSRAVASDPNPASKLLATGTTAPEFSAVALDGKPVTLSAFRGKVVLIDFWASWCLPCRVAMPSTQELAKKLMDAGVPVVVLGIDDGEPLADFQKWVSDNQSKYPNMLFAHGKSISLELYKVSGIPSQYIIDKAGVVRASYVDGDPGAMESAMRAAAG
jgi:thiol-disulfide isomerase/thioredoxin